MADSFAQILAHITFHTKADGPLIKEEHLPRMFEYLGGATRSLNGIPFAIGGRPDHIHILTSLPKTMALSDFMMNIKKGCSKWIKLTFPDYSKFAWQDGYAAFSVSYSNKERVIGYISNQKEHHRYKSMQEEMRMFLEANGINYDERYI